MIRGLHSDRGSNYINHTVAKLLNKLLIEQTKSRPRHSNDNGLAEAKNGAVIRKHMGHWHIAAEHAEVILAFYGEHFNPYLNFHRPCGGMPQIRSLYIGSHVWSRFFQTLRHRSALALLYYFTSIRL